ncbi:MAG: PEP-CTERM sorting domain-containing protein [Planctomycetes bacterium]|nr:PEP-CTERM sorting domain-containing protein [Planctomycetota bacterium]
MRSRRALRAAGVAAALMVAWLTGCLQTQAITVEVRLVCDLVGSCGEGDFFFDNPEALETLQFATRAFEPFADSLSAVTVSPMASFQNPDTGAIGFGISNLFVQAETVIVYAGGRDLPDGQVGAAGPGTPLNTFDRGQGVVTGAGATDFAPWGGAIAFDTTALDGSDRNWNFGIQNEPAPGQVDFLSVALHELGHLFGFGTADSFANQVVDNAFEGSTSVGLYGEPVPTFPDGQNVDQHWGNGLTSPPYANEPRVALGRSIVSGRRTVLSPVDYAAFDDIGWEVPPQLLGLQGNSDNDADVDGSDFLAWQRGSGLTGVGAALGDLSGDTDVDDYDLWLWAQNFGATAAASSTATSFVVPEPSTASILALAIGGILVWRRRRGLTRSAGPFSSSAS